MSERIESFFNYSNQHSEPSIEHIQKCIDNKASIKNGNYKDLEGCPTSFGLDDSVDLCEIETVEGNDAQRDQCETCWKQSLGV